VAGLEVNLMYVFPVSSPDFSQNLDIKVANRSFKNVSQFKYWVMMVTKENLTQDK
jgi:hypothetical protein